MTHKTVEKARKANPEQAPGLPSEPPHVDRRSQSPAPTRPVYLIG